MQVRKVERDLVGDARQSAKKGMDGCGVFFAEFFDGGAFGKVEMQAADVVLPEPFENLQDQRGFPVTAGRVKDDISRPVTQMTVKFVGIFRSVVKLIAAYFLAVFEGIFHRGSPA